MSERIRELAEQCVGDRPYNNSFDYEKFAELIIQECIGKKEWVGLTDGEIDILSCETVKGNKSVNWLCKVLEARLKEKNT